MECKIGVSQLTSANSISSQIIEAILSQRLAPNTRLGEQDLAALFGCSRTVVREALVDLAARGIVIVSPRRGWYLTEVDVNRAAELYEAREILETGLLRFSGQRRCKLETAALDRIAAHLSKQADALAGNDAARRAYLLGDFHVCLANCLGNSVLAAYLRDLTVLTRLFTMRHQNTDDARRSYDEHVAVFDALVSGDMNAAAEAMHRHLSTWREKVHLVPAVDRLSQLRNALAPSAGDPDAPTAGKKELLP